MNVAVCICTYRRPDTLRGLLKRLVDVAATAGEGVDVAIVIVDDDPAATARPVAAEFSAAFPLGVWYDNPGSGNISVARNRALELGIDHGDWLALIDDDCLPEEDWVGELLAVQSTYRAECVSGRCVDVPPLGAPGWLVDEPFLSEFGADKGDGDVLDNGPLKNTLISAEFIRRTGLRFDPDFGRSGGEDSMFFYTAHQAGMRHRFAAKAIVQEQVPLARTTLAYQLRRSLWYGSAEGFTNVMSGRRSRGRMIASGLKTTVIAMLRPLVRLGRGESPQLRFALAEALHGLGRLAGASGIRLRHG